MIEFFRGLFVNKGSVNINGNNYVGRTISIVGNKVIVDGVVQGGDITDKIVNVSVTGDVQELRTVSGDIQITGRTGNVHTTSGDVRCGHIDGDVKTVSGDVDCASVHGSVRTVSGDITHY